MSIIGNVLGWFARKKPPQEAPSARGREDIPDRNAVKTSGKGPASRRKVLIVDPEPVIADTVAMILRQSGYETAVAYDAEKALAQAEVFLPDFLVCEIGWVGHTYGIEFAVAVRRRWPDCAILMNSGSRGSADHLQAAAEAGYPFEVIAKPFHPQDLLQKLAAMA